MFEMRFDEDGSPEIENLADAWEEEQEVLRQLAEEENFQAGDAVLFNDDAFIALFGSGVNTVERVNSDGSLTVRLWHGKRSVKLARQEFRKVSAEDFSEEVLSRVLQTIDGDKVSTADIVNALMAQFSIGSTLAFQVADEFMANLSLAGR